MAEPFTKLSTLKIIIKEAQKNLTLSKNVNARYKCIVRNLVEQRQTLKFQIENIMKTVLRMETVT